MQLGEPGCRRRERLDAEHTAVGVERGGDMDIEVGVDPTSDRARLYDGHGHPFSVQVVKGWHARPGKETVTIGLRQQTDRSPSGTGRARIRPRSRPTGISTTRCHQSVRPEPQEPLNVASPTPAGEHAQHHTAILTGMSAWTTRHVLKLTCPDAAAAVRAIRPAAHRWGPGHGDELGFVHERGNRDAGDRRQARDVRSGRD